MSDNQQSTQYYHTPSSFYAPSQNLEKRLLVSSCRSVCPHWTTRL